MLQVWHHPRTQEIRLYFSRTAIQNALDVADAALELGTVRGWVYNLNGHPDVKVSIKQDAPVDRLLINDIKEALRSAAPFTDNDSWDNLVVVTENPAELHSEASEPTTEKIDQEPVAPELEPLDEKSPNAQGFVRQTQPRNAEASKLLIASIKIPKPLTIEVARKETRLMADLLAD